ncbi:MAG: hypothetical protein HPY59_16465 [Anaerolineae bacterium]|nr:hypothetical protein [Anaerolineae bacterium]
MHDNLAQLLDPAYWFALAKAPATGYELLYWIFILLALAGVWSYPDAGATLQHIPSSTQPGFFD